ncbi:hypothetical protein G6F35_015683 [Rhizopus arrhizus]|nr:hypothetical protein G6F35_015683 [Rhizopus arrhizus]
MVLSNKNSLVPLGAPSKPNKPPNTDNNSTTSDELHTSPSLNYLTAVTGKLTSSDPRVVTRSSTVTLNANCRPSASATSAPTYTVTPKSVPMFCNFIFHCHWRYCCLHKKCLVVPHLKATVL